MFVAGALLMAGRGHAFTGQHCQSSTPGVNCNKISGTYYSCSECGCKGNAGNGDNCCCSANAGSGCPKARDCRCSFKATATGPRCTNLFNEDFWCYDTDRCTADPADVLSPEVVAVTPSDGMLTNTHCNISFTFNENVSAGTGGISLGWVPLSLSSILSSGIKELPIQQASVSGRTVSINANVTISRGLKYTLSIPALAVFDGSGNSNNQSQVFAFEVTGDNGETVVTQKPPDMCSTCGCQSRYNASALSNDWAGGNVALNKPATASGSCCDSAPSNGNDGKAKGWTQRGANSAGKWWQVDLQSVQEIGLVRTQWTASDRWDHAVPVDFQLQASSDGSSWFLAKNIIDAPVKFPRIDDLELNPPVQARYLKLVFNRAHAIPSGWQASYVSWVLINFEAYSRRKTCGEVNLQAMDQAAYDGTPRCAALKSSYKTSCCSDLSCDITAPRIVDYGPLQGAVGVLPTTDIMLTFNEPIQAGSGSVILVPTYGIPQKIPVQDAQVSFLGDVLKINRNASLVLGMEYALSSQGVAVLDSSNNSFTGLQNVLYNFKVECSTPAWRERQCCVDPKAVLAVRLHRCGRQESYLGQQLTLDECAGAAQLRPECGPTFMFPGSAERGECICCSNTHQSPHHADWSLMFVDWNVYTIGCQ